MKPKDVEYVEECLAYLKADIKDYDSRSKVANFYKDKSVFITGATGFIGKFLVEKLIRSSPGIKRIYVLIREKKGKSVDERLSDFLNRSQVFDRIKSHRDGTNLLRSKIYAIKGDVTLPEYGISKEQMLILKEDVDIVFNGAATVRFDEPLDVAVKNNIFSAAQLVAFCNHLDKLKAIVHISTAYTNSHKKDPIYEIFYEPPMKGDDIQESFKKLREIQEKIHLYPNLEETRSEQGGGSIKVDNYKDNNFHLKNLSRDACFQQNYFNKKQQNNEKSLNLLSEFNRIALECSNRPNTYTMTKAIGENYILELCSRQPDRYLYDKIPLAIVRPSIVSAASKEPQVGLIDNFNGTTGPIMSVYTGLVQSMPGIADYITDIVPVDMVTNMLICCAYYMVTTAEAKKSHRTSNIEHSPKCKPNDNNNDNDNNKNNNDYDNEKGKEKEEKFWPSNQVKMDKGAYIFNICTSYRNPVTWREVAANAEIIAFKYPTNFMFRMPYCDVRKKGRFYDYEIYDFINHKLPSLIIDFFKSKLLSIELNSKNSSLATYNRIRAMSDAVAPFGEHEFIIHDGNVSALNDSMTSTDRELYPFDVTNIDWPVYFQNYTLGIRLYLLKDKVKDLPKARKMLRM